MKYIRTTLWVGAFLFACFLQLKCVQNVDITIEKLDSAARADSIKKDLQEYPFDHSELDLEKLHEAQMQADQKAIMERQRKQQ